MTGKPLEILVVEDNEHHRKAAKELLKEHKTRTVSTFDDAISMLDCFEKTEKGRPDALLTDLNFSFGGRTSDLYDEHKFKEEPLGYALALYAAKIGVPKIAIVTDMNHHHNALAKTFDYLKLYGDRFTPFCFRLSQSDMLLFDVRDLPVLYLHKEGYVVKANEYVEPPEELKSSLVTRTEYDDLHHTNRDWPVEVKNWKAALDSLYAMRILIADDSFEDPKAARIAVQNMMVGLWDSSGKKQPAPIKIHDDDYRDDTYISTPVPFDSASSMHVEVASSIDSAIAKARSQWDWIISDLNYGEGFELGGLKVIEAVRKYERPVKAICTSTDITHDLEAIKGVGVDYTVSSRGRLDDKFTLLGKTISHHYFGDKQK